VTCDDLELLSAWDIGAVRAVDTPATGTINRTLLVEADRGSYVLRVYRHADGAPVEREHAVIAHVCARGLPAVAPIALPGGSTILECDGRFYALFPRAPGRQLAPSQLSAGDFAAMGAFLARTHQALADAPLEHSRRWDFAIDRAATLAGIANLEATIRSMPERSQFDTMVLGQLAARRAWIAHTSVDQAAGLDGLEQQLIHGDYQETNLFFEAGQIVAIIDWDQTYVAPRAWEIVRALHLSCKFAAEPSRVFIGAYREQLPLDPDELDLVAWSYGLMRAHDLWLFRAIYVDRNDRLRQFVTPGDDAPGEYVPIMDRWEAVRGTL
jgi:homoserine kinase type II